MKKYIQKIKGQDKEHRKKMAQIFAGVTTVIIVIIWMVLVSVFKTQEEPSVQESTGPNIEEFFQQAGQELGAIGDALGEERQNFELILEEEVTQEEQQDVQEQAPEQESN